MSTIALFEEKQVRRVWHEEQWYFAVSDVIEILTDSVDVKQYIKRLRSRDPELNSYWGTNCTPPSGANCPIFPDGSEVGVSCPVFPDN